MDNPEMSGEKLQNLLLKQDNQILLPEEYIKSVKHQPAQRISFNSSSDFVWIRIRFFYIIFY